MDTPHAGSPRVLPRKPHGLTMIELLVAMAILGFAMAAVMPEVGGWMRGLAVRNSAESLRVGIERARMEALRRNTNVSFWLVSDGSKSLSNGCVLSNTGPSWVVSGANPNGKCGAEPSNTVDPLMVDKWSAREGASVGVQLTAVDGAGIAVGSVTFTSLGQVLATGPQIARIDIEHTTPGVRALRVQIEPGGSVRLCDPAVGADDPRHCWEPGA